MRLLFVCIDLFLFGLPFYFSFQHKITLFKKWRSLVPALLIPSLLVLLWEMVFLRLGVWSYQLENFIGTNFRFLPVEIILYYFVSPYFILFVYELSARIHQPKPAQYFGKITAIGFSLLSAWLLYRNFDSLFIAITAMLLLATLLNHLIITKGDYLNHIFLTWILSLLIFFLIDLAMYHIPLQVINPEYASNMHVFSIPLEKILFNLLYVIWVIWVFERYKHDSREMEPENK